MKTLIEFTEHAYDSLLDVVEGITQKELNWRPISEMNSAYRIFRHTARISFILLPQVVEGTTTGDWDDDYEQHEQSLQGMLRDLETGRIRVLSGLRSLQAIDLDEMIPLWGQETQACRRHQHVGRRTHLPCQSDCLTSRRIPQDTLNLNTRILLQKEHPEYDAQL